MSDSSRKRRKDLPDFLYFLEVELGQQVKLRKRILEHDLFFVDLSDWKLRFSDRTPFIYVAETHLALLEPHELAQRLTDIVRTGGLYERLPIILVQGRSSDLREHVRSSFFPILILDQEDQDAVRNSRYPRGELLDRLSAQLPLSLLAPYDTSRPVHGSRFFGREFELKRILQGGESNFAIMGTRRIGKTSLLREIEHRLREQIPGETDEAARDRIVFMDCSAFALADDFVIEVVRKLHPQELARLESRQYKIYFPDFLSRMARRAGGPLVFLLDEFDHMLAWHFKDPLILNALRASSNQGSCRYIIAGFREMMRATSDLNSPLFNFVRPIRLNEFTRDQTAQLVLEPLEKLQVRFERRHEVVDRIYNETAGQPNLVQFYCNILVEQMDRRGVRTISPESLFEIHNDANLRAFVLSTFMDNTTHLEKAIVFALVRAYGGDQEFGTGEIRSALEEQGVSVPVIDIVHACANLELAGTFSSRGSAYRFTNQVFAQMLQRNYDVAYLMQTLIEEGI